MLGGEYDNCIITSEVANQQTPKALFTCVVYTNAVNRFLVEWLCSSNKQFLTSEWKCKGFSSQMLSATGWNKPPRNIHNNLILPTLFHCAFYWTSLWLALVRKKLQFWPFMTSQTVAQDVTMFCTLCWV